MQDTPHNTKGMVVDIDKVYIAGYGKMDLISNIPYLDTIPSWRSYNSDSKIPRNQLARYIVYVYSWDSFMWKMQLTLPEVKEKAIELSGLSSIKTLEREMVMEKVYWLKGDEILMMVHDYLRVQNKDLWTDLVTLRHELDEANLLRLRPQGTEGALSLKEKSALRDDVDEMIKRIEIVEKKFYGQFAEAKDGTRKRMVTLESRAMNILDNVRTN